MPTLDETIDYMKQCHVGQTTRGGDPYWTHPLAVMEILRPEATPDELHAALLHDVMEDCGVTADDLRVRGYSERTIALVEGLSRPGGKGRPSYMDWIRSIAASGDVGLIKIKLADNRHNALPERIAKLPEGERSTADRYRRSMEILLAALNR
jgi:(p)ppGpp synthase/HD superfamily hydrolase